MPTILREEGWAVMIHTDDHPPPHVHVKRPGGYVKVALGQSSGMIQILRVV